MPMSSADEIPAMGTFRLYDSPLAKDTPVRTELVPPGPVSTTMDVMSAAVFPVILKASCTSS